MKVNFRALLMVVLVCVVSGCTGVVDPNVITQAESLPETMPWDLKKLSAAPEFQWDKGDKVRSLYYKGEDYKGKPTRVFAYYATPGTLSGDPSKDKNLPAMVLVHGGGGKAFPKWVELWASRGYAAIAMDLGGCGPDKKPLADGGPGQKENVKFGSMSLPDTDQWTYHAAANVIKAHSLIRSFPEVDAERTALTGISWGGYLTCIVAGLDNRFQAAVPVYGCGYIYENSPWKKHLDKMSEQDRAKWIELWDPSRYVGSSSMPMLFVNGGRDFAYRVNTHAKTYALVKSPKNIHYVPNLPHGHIFHRPKAIHVYIQSIFENGKPLAKVGALTIGETEVTAVVESQTKLAKAQLHYTTAPFGSAGRNRKWITVPATLKDNKITAKLPPKEATAWFLTVVDERKTTVSSRVVFSK